MTQPKQTQEHIKDPTKDQAHPPTLEEGDRNVPRSAPSTGSAAGVANKDQAPAAGGAPSEIQELERQLQAARMAAAESQDKFLRAKAEADNVRKRAEIDIMDAHKYGVERFAAEMLAVRDSLEAAKAQDLKQGTAVVEKVLQGLDLTLKLMEVAFQKFAVGVIDPQGQKFDPEKHQAMSIVETADMAPNHVVKVVQKGYTVHNRLIRPALVVVSKAPAAGPPKGGEEQKSGSNPP